MKKIWLAIGVAALGTIPSMGATCSSMSGQTLAQFAAAGTCTAGSSNQWTLSNWNIGGDIGTTGFGGALPTASDLIVEVSDSTSGVTGNPGFAVTFKNNPNATNNFFQVVNGQNARWDTQFFATANSAANVITEVSNFLFSPAAIGDGTLNNLKQVRVPGFSNLGSANIGCLVFLGNFGCSPGNPVDVSGVSGNTGFTLSVIDTFSISAGSNSAAVLGGYTNLLYGFEEVTSTVPEPMSFVLLGAGLVGIAALRRR